ncbi:unnamed protein product [Mytilus coruscus]|uniref:G-protein coupled receptors family 1 profile domain-containing protein n=1 Tax=Mytilus coruscus TaxID=42192 RepID=A0A6J8DWU6_MYTCO|nr:unnamed protein product [Mytilus coruscus]
MENATSVAVITYQSDNYSNTLAHSASQLNMSTSIPAKTPFLGDIEYKEFVRRWLEFSFMICLSLIGTFGNVHTILVYTRVEEMIKRSHVRTLITWLSVVDLITCFAVMPFETVTIRLNYSVSSNEACKLFRFIGHTTIMSSWLLLTVIAHERYRNIYSIFLGNNSVPGKCRKMTSWVKLKSTFFQHNLVCTLIIILSVIVSSPIFVFLGIVKVPLNTGLSATQCTTHKQYRGKLTAGFVNDVNPSHVPRSVADCKKKWQDLQAATKKKEATRRSEARATGGGPPPVCNFKPWESTVLQTLTKTQVEGIEGGVDTFEDDQFGKTVYAHKY